MTATLNIRIDRGGMIRKGKLNKPFFLLMDRANLGEINWGDQRSYPIPAGKHTLTLKYKPFEMWWVLDIEAVEGGSVEVDSFMDMKKGKFTLINKSNGMTSDDHPASPNPEQLRLIATKTKHSLLQRFLVGILGGIFAGLGGFLVFLWSNFNGGFGSTAVAFMMYFMGSVLGGALGWAVGYAISAFFKK